MEQVENNLPQQCVCSPELRSVKSSWLAWTNRLSWLKTKLQAEKWRKEYAQLNQANSSEHHNNHTNDRRESK